MGCDVQLGGAGLSGSNRGRDQCIQEWLVAGEVLAAAVETNRTAHRAPHGDGHSKPGFVFDVSSDPGTAR